MTKLVLYTQATPSLNDWANSRGRFTYARLRATWMRRINHAWFEAKAKAGHGPALWLFPPKGRVRLTVERFGRTEAGLDQDNFEGGLKPVIDALKKLQFVDDDDRASIELVTEQHKNPYPRQPMWARITLERLEG